MIPQSALEQINKPELQQVYKELFNQDPDPEKTKAMLIDEIVAKQAGNGLPPQGSSDIVEAPKTPEKPAEKKAEMSDLRLIKRDASGKIVDRSSTTKAAFNNLPAHRYGWEIEPPKEIA
jgi:hypothetical protein